MARYEPAGRGDFECCVTLFPPLVVVSPPRPSQRESEVTKADRIVIAQLSYRHIEKMLHPIKN
jgi:hypothetical protein